MDGPHGIFADRMQVATGGAMIKRTPNDPAWYRGGLWHDDHPINVPGFWFMSWYDVSVGPEPGGVQFDAQECPAGYRQSAVRDDRADAALLSIQARHARTPSSASAAWATRGWIMTRSPTAGSIIS